MGGTHKAESVAVLSNFRSFVTPEHEIPLHAHSTQYSRVYPVFGIDWPNATEHPLFYVGIYAAIGLGSALANILSVSAQYTGALRASRTLFKRVILFSSFYPTHSLKFRQLLVTVVRATFRFHDTTPQGDALRDFPYRLVADSLSWQVAC